MPTIDSKTIEHIQNHLGVYNHTSVFRLMHFAEQAFNCEGYEDIKTCPICMNFYATANLYGSGMPQNVELGISLYEKSARLGLAKAQFNLCLVYEKGNFVKKDIKMAYKLCQASADQNYPDAVKALPRLKMKYLSISSAKHVNSNSSQKE